MNGGAKGVKRGRCSAPLDSDRRPRHSVRAMWEHVFVSARSDAMEALGAAIATLAAHISAATARWLLLIADCDYGGVCADGGYKNCAHWLSWRCGIAPGTARDHVRVAHGLQRRPLLAAALGRGEVSYSKVRALVRLDDDFCEELMLDYANSSSAGQLERIVRGCRKVVATEEGSERQFAERELNWFTDDAGALVLRGSLPAELGALVVRAIEAIRDELGPPSPEVSQGWDAEDAEQSRSPAARNADALVAVAQSALAERTSSADVYQVVVHVDADALAVSAETTSRCELEGGQPLPSAAVRRLGCDASIVRVLEKDGKTISMGRKTRTISPATRRALRTREGGSTFPACRNPNHTAAHHAEHWAAGEPP